MNTTLSLVSVLVSDYDEAIDFYTRKLNFELVSNTMLSSEKRWVVVKPRGQGGCSILLAKASNKQQQDCIGNQSGGRVFLFLTTDNLDRDHTNLKLNEVKIAREPVVEAYGRVLVFEDLYGNKFDLIEPV